MIKLLDKPVPGLATLGVLLFAYGTQNIALAHGGGLDSYGCHNQTSNSTYHCHSGSFNGQSFSSKNSMLVVLNSDEPNAGGNQPSTPSEPSTPSTAYDRGDYLTSWRDADGDCQDTRQEVLIRQSRIPVVLSSDGCTVLSGAWEDPYTGYTLTDPSSLDIDHVVPLKEAHESGAWTWGSEQKRAYANDLANSMSLIGVLNSANRSKSDRDPANWMPPNELYHCEYIKSWVVVKELYGLSMDSAELVAINNILDLSKNTASPERRVGATLTSNGNVSNQSEFSVAMTKPGTCGYSHRSSPSESITLTASVTPDSNDIGQTVDIVVVAQLGDVLVIKTTDGAFIPWDLSMEKLQPAIKSVNLSETFEFEIITGELGMYGTLNVFLGYLRNNGELVYSPNPVNFEFVN
jgi:hypothetical protein